MNVISVARRLGGGEFHYALGRFPSVRQVYGRLHSRFAPAPPSFLSLASATPFEAKAIDRSLRALDRDGIAPGFDLPPHLIQQVYDYAETTPCHFWEKRFLHHDAPGGRLADGTDFAMTEVCEPKGCPAIRDLLADPVLLTMASRYIGAPIKRATPRLYWSYANDLSIERRRELGQGIDWYYDGNGWKFCSVHFYLTDVDENNGPHEVVRGSHQDKPLRLLFGPAKTTDEKIRRFYGNERIVHVEGPAGTGFFEDTACYHRIVAPRTRDRLMLEIWYV